MAGRDVAGGDQHSTGMSLGTCIPILVDTDEDGLDPQTPVAHIASDAGLLASVTSAVVDLLVLHPDRALGQGLPLLSMLADGLLPLDRFRTRTRTVFARAGIATWSDLRMATPASLGAVPASGRLTVRDAIEVAVVRSIEIGCSGAEPAAIRSQLPPDHAPGDDPLGRALARLTTWAASERASIGLDRLLVLADEERPPASIVTALAEALRSTPPQAEPPASLDELLGDLVDHLGERLVWILRARVLTDSPRTLQQLGDELGVTRERVRQLQAKAEEQLEALLAADEPASVALLGWRAHDLAQHIGTCAPDDAPAVQAALNHAARDVSVDREVVTALLLRRAGAYRTVDGWLVRGGQALPSLDSILHVFDDQGLAARTALGEALGAAGIAGVHRERWVDQRALRVLDEVTVARWDGSVASKCIALLAHLGRPATVEELNLLVDEGHNVRATKNQLHLHPAVIRSGPRTVALRAWGGEEYTSIAEEIAQAVAQGPVPLAELTDRLGGLFGLRPGSVRAYADAPAFVVEDGAVRLRRADEPYPLSSDLRRVRHAFRPRARQLVWSCLVDRDVLRGSGRALSPNAGAVIGVAPGDDITFDSAFGGIRITWPMTAFAGPAVGSLRRIAEGLRVVEGDVLAISFDADDLTATSTFLPSDWARQMWPEASLLRLTGLERGPDLVGRAAAAIDSTPESVAEDLRSRGDDSVADLIARLA